LTGRSETILTHSFGSENTTTETNQRV